MIKERSVGLQTRKKSVCIIDTETIKLKGKNIVFDIAWTIYDEDLKIIKSDSYLIKEFIDKMETAYYYHNGENRAYYTELVNNTDKVKNFNDVMNILLSDLIKNNVAIFSAFNFKFDRGAINSTFDYLDINRSIEIKKLNDKGVDAMCLMNLAIQETIPNINKYRSFCVKNKFYTSSGNVRTTAEAMYNYYKELFLNHTENTDERYKKTYELIKSNNNILNELYKEEHNALSDTLLEGQLYFILKYFNKTLKEEGNYTWRDLN